MKLKDILPQSTAGNIRDAWEATQPADDFGKPLPGGDYIARIIQGELIKSRANQTPGYCLAFEVIEPNEHKGRKFWHPCWLTTAAMPQTKRDLGKLGVTSLVQLEKELPKFIRCKVKLALRKEDDGMESNRVRSFEVVGIDKPELDAFAPTDEVQPIEEVQTLRDDALEATDTQTETPF